MKPLVIPAEMPLIQLLRVALGRSDQLDKPLSNADWVALLEVARKQTLTGVLMEGIKRLPVGQQPDTETMFQWLAAAERTKQSSRRLNRAAVQICERLERDGVPAVVLKGQGVSMLYDEPLTRTPGDIDLWIGGGRKRIVAYIRQYFPNESVVYHHMDFPVFKKISVEAHFTPSWMYSPLTNRRLQQWFQGQWAHELANRVSLPEGTGTVSISTTAFNRVYIALHIYRHLLDEGVGLRQVLDYYHVLNSDENTEASSSERSESIRVLCSLGMKRFMGALAWVMCELFSLDDNKQLFKPDPKEGAFLLNEIMQAGNFGKYDVRFAHEQIGDTHFRRFVRKQQRNLHFLAHYPSEVLWHPLWRIWHFFWRRMNGYQ
ncbi:MAG: nucleotidyltransferase family protein [Bacteroidaceae bacterium]|nr:nucleotidyltransferase family protein [Bacteroidaceae bacterium]